MQNKYVVFLYLLAMGMAVAFVATAVSFAAVLDN
jgi:hypothetical protein